MRLNLVAAVLMAGIILAIMVTAQTPPEPLTNLSNQPANSSQDNTTQGSYVEGELLVRFDPNAFPTANALEASSMKANAAIGAVMVNTYDGIPGLSLVRLPPGMSVDQGMAYYKGIPTVMYAEVNAIYSIANASSQGNITSPHPANSSTGDLFVKYNVTAFPSSDDLARYANATNAAINATLVTDYTGYGMPGLQLVNLTSTMGRDQGMAYYRNITYVLYVEPNVQYSAGNRNNTANQTNQTSK